VLCFSASSSNAQQIDPTTGNLVYTTVNPPPDGWSNHSWSGFTNTTSNGGGFSGGNIPGYNPSTGTFMFGYNQGTVSYSTPIAAAFANAGPGILVNGLTYSWKYYNQQDYRGTLSGNINLTSNTGSVLHSYNYTMPQTTAGWTNVSGVQNFGTQYNPLSLGNLNVNFTGKDDRWWAGYYGPQIKDIDVRLRYSVDPCVANPLYASHCPGFNDIVTSGNLVPYPTGGASWGSGINQTFAISTALQHGGLGVKVHGLQYGFDAYVGNPYYNGWFWTDYRDPDLYVNVNVRDSAGNSIYSSYRKGEFDDKPYWQTYNYSYVLPQSRNSLTLGNFEFTAQTYDAALITNMYARLQYTPDQCVLNPLFSSSCTGYQQAYFNQQCSLNPLYNNQCPGYAEAYYSQQCSISPLYDSGCPGYAAAYFTQQCTINGLYDKLCPNYQSAFLASQCEKNQLYSTQCSGYQQAKLLKDLQDQQAAQTQAATQSSSPTSTTTASSSTSSPTATTNAATADPTRTETVVTTDVGGVELTTSGQISVPTGQPAASKESTTAVARTEESRTETPRERETERRRVDPRALAVAMAAVAATERTALATAEQAVVMSQASVGPNDGTGISLGSGLSLQATRSQGMSDDKSDDRKNQEKAPASQRGPGPTDNINLLAAPIQPAPDSNQKSGPSVRRGGAVEGMEGGPDPAALARAPLDFNQYLNSQLKDAQFYSSREIYKGQRTVDNARAQRFLNGASDVLHQRMVEQQYQIGQ
jgi:hypothetical protein